MLCHWLATLVRNNRLDHRRRRRARKRDAARVPPRGEAEPLQERA